MDQMTLESYPGTWETGHVRRQYMAIMELLDADVFTSNDMLYQLVNSRAAVLGEELDKRFGRQQANGQGSVSS